MMKENNRSVFDARNQLILLSFFYFSCPLPLDFSSPVLTSSRPVISLLLCLSYSERISTCGNEKWEKEKSILVDGRCRLGH
mmetsp:Transcript_39017/g.76749  ORF Transcript_39017/g.76749 Transcript_39017/m.76749 type:complete len:81 (+) Transcript_39017:1603-1845(+)